MTWWTVYYTLSCGCRPRTIATDKTKLAPGDVWRCETHGPQEIIKEQGHGR